MSNDSADSAVSSNHDNGDHGNGTHHAPSWTHWFTLLSIAFAVLALVATIWWFGPQTLWAQLVAIGWGFLAIIAIEGLVSSCDSAALYACLGHAKRHLTYWHVLKAQIGGRAINTVTPLANLGEATKATILMQRVASKHAIAAVIRYNLITQGVRLTLMAIGAPICAFFLTLPTWLTITLYVGGAVAVALLALGGYLVHRGMLGTFVQTLRTLRLISPARAAGWAKKVNDIDEAIAQRDPKAAGRQHWSYATPLGWLIISRLLSMASLWTALALSGYVANVGTLMAMATAGQILNLPAALVPMGLGVLESGNGVLLAALGAAPSLGVTATLAGRVTSIIYAVIGLGMLAASDVAQNVSRVRKRKQG